MIDLLRKRRSIRKFTPEKVSDETREALVETALRAPSSRGINPWEFVLVDDRRSSGNWLKPSSTAPNS